MSPSRIPDATVDQVRDRADLVDIIRETVELKKDGQDHWAGLCPFHSEKSSSFKVSISRQRYHCFGCHQGGDVFAWVEFAQNLRGFPESVRVVAGIVGIEVEEATASSQSSSQGGSLGRGGSQRELRSHAPAAGRGPSPAEASSRKPSRKRGAEVVGIDRAKGHQRGELVERYDYTTPKGVLVYQVERYFNAETGKKTFLQRRPHPKQADRWVYKMGPDEKSGLGDQPTILYRLPDLVPAVRADDPIWFCEGEKDVNVLRGLDQVATTSSGGAGKWRDELAAGFKGYKGTVRIVRDRDEPGEAHAIAIFESLAGVLDGDATLQIVEAKAGKDASDHLGAGNGLEDFVQVWPLPENLLAEDPKRFKQIMLARALEQPLATLTHTSHAAYKHVERPLFTSGLLGLRQPLNFEGCVVVTGLPSSAKSYLALGAAIDNALAGWDTVYLTAEMGEGGLRSRAARCVASHGLERFDLPSVEACAEEAKHARLPDRFTIVNVHIGVTLADVIEKLIQLVTDRPTLVIIDSVSSLKDQMQVDPKDSYGMGALREITRWVTSVARMTHGQLSFLVLSEMNREGRAAGRSLDHRCDLAIAMESSDQDGQSQVKTIRVTKNWNGPTGRLGDFVHFWQIARLCRLDVDQ